MLCRKAPARFHRSVHLNQMLVVDAGDHHRVDLAENAPLGQHFQTLHLALVRIFAASMPVTRLFFQKIQG